MYGLPCTIVHTLSPHPSHALPLTQRGVLLKKKRTRVSLGRAPENTGSNWDTHLGNIEPVLMDRIR